jgi:hypothetical protein
LSLLWQIIKVLSTYILQSILEPLQVMLHQNFVTEISRTLVVEKFANSIDRGYIIIFHCANCRQQLENLSLVECVLHFHRWRFQVLLTSLVNVINRTGNPWNMFLHWTVPTHTMKF